MSAPMPSMSDRGWITAVPEKMDLLLSYFFESDGIQSYLYNGYVTNLQAMLQKFGNNIPVLCQQLRSALEVYFGRHFDAAVLDVQANNDPTVNPTNAITLTINATINDGGVDYTLGSLVQVTNSTFKRVMGVINTGTIPSDVTGV